MKTKRSLSAGLTTVLLTAGSVSHAAVPRDDLLGDRASPSQATRTVTVNSDTSQVNVEGGEIVGFSVNGENFAWHFNGPAHSIDLGRILPAGVLTHKVTVYIAPNPLTPGY